MESNNPSLLGFVYKNLKFKNFIYREAPKRIVLTNNNSVSGFPLTSSLDGVVYCLVADRPLNGYRLVVDGKIVANTKLEIMLWVLNNAPRTFKEAVRLSIVYEDFLKFKQEKESSGKTYANH